MEVRVVVGRRDVSVRGESVVVIVERKVNVSVRREVSVQWFMMFNVNSDLNETGDSTYLLWLLMTDSRAVASNDDEMGE